MTSPGRDCDSITLRSSHADRSAARAERPKLQPGCDPSALRHRGSGGPDADPTSRAWRLGRRYVTPAAYGCAPCGIGAGRRYGGSTAVAGSRPSFSGDLPPPAASERGKQPRTFRLGGPPIGAGRGRATPASTDIRRARTRVRPIRRYVRGHLRRETVGAATRSPDRGARNAALWSGPGDNPINAAVRQRLRPR